MPATKKPQDRLAPSQPAANTAEQEHPEGWELLKPYDEVPVWEQLELVEIVKPLIPKGVEPGQSVELDLNSIDLSIIGNLAKKLQDFAVDPGAYLSFVSGPQGLTHAMDLGIAYAMQLGESGRSATS